MKYLKKLLVRGLSTATLLAASLFTAQPASAWHGPGCGFGGGTFTARGYGFGLNHHSFRPSVFNPAWNRSYASISFSSGFYGSHCWPRSTYFAGYASPVVYSGYWPGYYNTYYVPYCPPSYYFGSYYTPYVAPVYYSNFYSGFPTCSLPSSSIGLPVSGFAASGLNFSAQPLNRSLLAQSASRPSVNTVPFAVQTRTVQKPIVPAATALASTSSTPAKTIRLAAQTVDTGNHLVAADLDASIASPLDTAPPELMNTADAILAAGGHRQAAQAYAQLVLKFGNSNRLTTRRFVAQVASGDFAQAAVVVELAQANGNRIERADLPGGDLSITLGRGASNWINQRTEGLAAVALENPDDAAAMLAVAHWLSLSGDDTRAELFKSRAEQLQKSEAIRLVTKKND